MSARSDNLTDLADAVRELVEPRTHSEYLEAVAVVVSRNGRERRIKERRRHVVTLPGLLAALEEAVEPGSSEQGEGGLAGGFESRPAAAMHALAVLDEITRGVRVWARLYSIDRPTLAKTLSGLVSAQLDDAELAVAANQVSKWVRDAKLATGYDPSPRMLRNTPCPYCGADRIQSSGDMTTARCLTCGVDWTADTLGLLTQMLEQNVTQEKLALPRCWQGECVRYGDHETHGDGRGRVWADVCEIA